MKSVIIALGLSSLVATTAHAQYGSPGKTGVPAIPNAGEAAGAAAKQLCYENCSKDWTACAAKIRTESKARCDVKSAECRAACDNPMGTGRR